MLYLLASSTRTHFTLTFPSMTYRNMFITSLNRRHPGVINKLVWQQSIGWNWLTLPIECKNHLEYYNYEMGITDPDSEELLNVV